MKTKYFYFAVLSVVLLTLLSFSIKEQPSAFVDKAYSQFYSYLDSFREEKLYLQTDKPYYSAGESIWFKGYVVNAATMTPESFSNFIYVELINQEDAVVSRVKVLRDSTGFSGHIELVQTIPNGDYNLIAYTQWMRNNALEFFFSKKISIGNLIEEPITFTTNYGKMAKGNIEVSINFVDENLLPVQSKELQISGYWSGKRKNEMLLTTDSQGNVFFDLPVDTVKQMTDVLDLELNMEDYKFNSKIYLPRFSTDFDVQFFPESGVLLNNSKLQSVAFKAIGADGMSRGVNGKLCSQNGTELLDIKSQFNGMGKFMLNPLVGESYYVILKSKNGVEKRFELPKAKEEGVLLQLNFNREKVYYSVTNKLPNTSNPLYILVHSNGKLFVAKPLVSLAGQFSDSNLDAGIHTFSVVDSLGNVYCERLFFKQQQSPPKVSMLSDQEAYGKRELVNLNFKIQSELYKSSKGFYSISITDSHFVKKDTISDNIMSHLLLSSDIKGYIENPVSYFKNDSVSSFEKLDLLMLTQGWTRYNTSDLLNNQQERGDYLMEAGQTLTGKVTNLFGKPVKNCDVFSLVNSSVISTKTDSLGKYVFDGIGFQDSVTFFLRAQKEKGLFDVTITPDIQTFPEPNTHFINKGDEQNSNLNDYFNQSKLKFISSGGIRNIYLEEFTVRARKKERIVNENYLGIMANVVTSDELDRMRSWSVLNILRTISGVMVNGDKVTIRNNSEPPLLLIDRVPANDFSEIENLIADNIDNIQVLKDASASFFGSRGGNGVIAINTKSGEVNPGKKPISMATINPLGCQKPKEFYVPKYEVQSIKEDTNPDLRTTIYWNPHLSSDSNGEISLDFYTADPHNDYSVVLEGITTEGEICRYEGTIKRN